MKKLFCLFAILLFLLSLTGCTGPSSEPWKNVKAAELINQQQPLENKNMTVNLQIYLFTIQKDKLTEIQNEISKTDSLPLMYNSFNAFSTNGLIGCAGDRTSWQNIGKILAQSKPQVKKRISLLVAENVFDDVILAQSREPASFIYNSDNSTAGIGFDAGQIALRLKAKSLIGLRQACELEIIPVYKTGIEKNKKTFLNADKSHRYEFLFESAGFNVRIEPGQFILLAPNDIQTQQPSTIADFMFYSQTPKNTVGLCLIACSFINYPL